MGVKIFCNFQFPYITQTGTTMNLTRSNYGNRGVYMLTDDLEN